MAEAPAPRRRKLLALALSLLVSLLCAEGVVRVMVGAPMAERLPLMQMRANPARGWEMVPGTHYTYQHAVHVNALGLRGPELGEKRPGERRLLFLGDSLTYGQGVADGETVPAALEAALGARDSQRPWTVVNAGQRAYDTPQELGLLEELGARIQPDVVLLGWYWNDLSGRPILPTYERLKDKGELYFDTGSRLEGAERFRWHAQQLLRRSALVMWLHDCFSSKGEPYAPEIAEQGMKELGLHFERFRRLCLELGAAPVVVLFPDSHRLAGGDATRAFDERASALARERGLPVIELLPALEPFHGDVRRAVIPFDGHYNPEANAAMGAFLAGALLADERFK